MANFYSSQYQAAFVSKPSSKIKPGDVSGGIWHMYFEYVATASIPQTTDVIKLAKLPKGARVLDVVISAPDMGTTGALNIGWAASAELDGPTGLTGSPVEAANATGFGSAVDVNTTAVTFKASAGVPAGLMKEFAAEVDLQIAPSTVWTATSGTIKGYVQYVIV